MLNNGYSIRQAMRNVKMGRTYLNEIKILCTSMKKIKKDAVNWIKRQEYPVKRDIRVCLQRLFCKMCVLEFAVGQVSQWGGFLSWGICPFDGKRKHTSYSSLDIGDTDRDREEERKGETHFPGSKLREERCPLTYLPTCPPESVYTIAHAEIRAVPLTTFKRTADSMWEKERDMVDCSCFDKL